MLPGSHLAAAPVTLTMGQERGDSPVVVTGDEGCGHCCQGLALRGPCAWFSKEGA